ncbi:MAG: DUF4857 domain-containing protein [Bacteroidales bacterium]|nr:DUF4857 domain-containing protein [Bacteroidales bacterium]
MKRFKQIKYLVFVVVVLILAWISPFLWGLISDKATYYPFTYYSSVNHKFCSLNFKNDKVTRTDVDGNIYTENQWDSILPLLSYRQLAANGLLPDSLNGVPIALNQIRATNYYYRYSPKNLFSPSIPLYPLFESMSGRVDLELPGDVFRTTKNGVEFLDPKTNKVLVSKSEKYSKALRKKGFVGPEKWTAGTPTIQKAYDQGYFILDQNSNLFHFKRVNNKPFVRKIDLPNGIEPIYMATTEYGDKRSYGFVIDKNSQLYVLSTNNYKFIHIPVQFNYKTNKLVLMANMFYWNFGITSKNGKTYYAIDAKNFNVIDTFKYDKVSNKYSEISKYVFPFKLRFKSYNDGYIKPRFFIGSIYSLLTNLFFVLLFIVIKRIQKTKSSAIAILGVATTGIYGFIAAIILKLNRENS